MKQRFAAEYEHAEFVPELIETFLEERGRQAGSRSDHH